MEVRNYMLDRFLKYVTFDTESSDNAVTVPTTEGQFVFARLFSMGFEQVGLFVCIEWINVSQYSIMGLSGLMISKVVLSFVSVLLNYIASNFIIFKEKTE